MTALAYMGGILTGVFLAGLVWVAEYRRRDRALDRWINEMQADLAEERAPEPNEYGKVLLVNRISMN